MAIGPKIQLRRATTAQWSAANPVLASGELGLEIRAGRPMILKMGDGATAWNTLPYYSVLVAPALLDNDFLRGNTATGDWDRFTLASTKTILGIDALAPKADPSFTGSIMVSKDEDGAFGLGAGILINNPDSNGTGGASALRLMRGGNTKWSFVNDVAGNATDDLAIYGAGVATAVRIKSGTGVVELVQGQIKFPATQVASSDANTMDDYEEGEWTPIFQGDSGSIGSTAYSYQLGKYTKIGNLVNVYCFMTLTSKGSWSGRAKIIGLPFTSTFNSSGVMFHRYLTYDGQACVVAAGGSATIYIEISKSASIEIDLGVSGFAANTMICFAISYANYT